MLQMQKHKLYIGEYGPIIVGESGLTYGALIRFTRKLNDFSAEYVGELYGKVAGEEPVTGRHIQRMEINDSFFPKDPKRRWVLAQLLNVPVELMALVSLETLPPVEAHSSLAVAEPTSQLDREEYQATLQHYWLHGDTVPTIQLVRDTKARVEKLQDCAFYASSAQRPSYIRLLCSYQILLGDIANEQQCYAAAQKYLTSAARLAAEKGCNDLYSIALYRREAFLNDLGKWPEAFSDSERLKKVREHFSPQLEGKILALSGEVEARVARTPAELAMALHGLDKAYKLVGQPQQEEDFMFFVAFSEERYLLDRAAAHIASPVASLRSPQQAQELLDRVVQLRQKQMPVTKASLYKQAFSDLLQARIYANQGYWPIAASTAENVLTSLSKLHSSVHVCEVLSLAREIKQRYNGPEVSRLEWALLQVERPYLFN
ncbi:hypothetical protein EPA93_08005 [Ktedonosporobacter rubrisoli]|uniref:Uncharacterized protein n=1 Tax=Ktedonosporobacter rubrisoli TaxID=2509675 RepID=A0A4P6JLK3_KTERU|nr:hypothetical protein [Ktedonosporobacter rubrisoli]QBD75953.1 hypothetical protein EPA93_08005 [Ktedonosporobacter rubrisoli]